MKNLRLFYIVHLLMLIFVYKANAQNGEIEKIKTKYLAWLRGDSVDYKRSEVLLRYNSLIGNASQQKKLYDLSDYNFANPGPVYDFALSADQDEFSTLTEKKLIVMTQIYHAKGPSGKPNPRYHAAGLKDTILKIFQYLKEKGVNNTTSYEGNAGIILLRFAAYAGAVLSMKDELKVVNQFTHHLEALNNATYFYRPNNPDYQFTYTGFNSDGLRGALHQRFIYILAQEPTDPSRVANMNYIKTFLNNALQIAPGWSDCIKPDFTTYHHRGIYAPAYAPQAIHIQSIINLMLTGTAYQLNNSARDNLKKASLAYVKYAAKYDIPRAITGRFPYASTGAVLEFIPTFAYLYMADISANVNVGKEFIRLWNPSGNASITSLLRNISTGICLYNTLGAVDEMLKVVDAGLTPAAEPSGHYSFPYAGMSIHRRSDWMVSMKGTSKHIWQTETGPGQNILGRYNGSGVIEIYASGTPVCRDSSRLTEDGWDWSRLPGTTVEYRTVAELPLSSGAREFSDQDFLANASLDNSGIFAMQFKDINSAKGLTANKTVFCFDDVLLCLGSNIRDGDGIHPVQTTLFQTSLVSPAQPTVVNGSNITGTTYKFQQKGGNFWCTDAAGNGYVIPASNKNEDSVYVTRLLQTSKDESNTSTATDNFNNAWISHGKTPNNASYQYAIKIRGGLTATSALAQNFSTVFNVVRQDAKAHVVNYKPASIYGYVVFDSAIIFTQDYFKRVDKPSVIMTQELDNGNKLKLSLTNPNLGLLASGEHYTFKEISQDTTLVNKKPQIQQVKVMVKGVWSLSGVYSNVSLNPYSDSTELLVNTINGLPVQVLLTKNSTSVPAILPDFKLSIYPNPSIDQITISIPTISQPASLKFQVLNILGEVVDIPLKMSNNGGVLDVSNLPNGVYQLVTWINSNQVLTDKFIVAKID